MNEPMTPRQVDMENPSPDDLEAADEFYSRLITRNGHITPPELWPDRREAAADDQ